MSDIEIVGSTERLAEIAPEWEALLGRSRAPQATLSPIWMLAWWRVFGAPETGRELRTALFWREGRLVGLAPLLARRVWVGAAVPQRRLELLGSGEDEADEIASDYIGVLAERDAEHEVAHDLSRALVGGTLGDWGELHMSAMDASSPIATLLATALRAPVSTSLRVSGACPFIALSRSWDDYLAALPGPSRYLVRRSLRELERWTGGDFVLRAARTHEELARGRDILHDLHAQRWRAQGRAGVFASPRFRAFHDQVMPALFDRGDVELLWLEARGEPIAAAYNLISDGKVQYYQGGRRMDLPRAVRPGIVLHALAIRRAIELGRREYDFLGGAARYKLDLALESRPLCTLSASRGFLMSRLRSVTGYAAHLARRLRDRTKAVVAARTSSDPDASPAT